MNTNFRYLLFLINALFIGVDGGATSLEGVYIEDKGSVVFFSDDYLIVNLKSEDKKIFSPNKNNIKKEMKTSSFSRKKVVQHRTVKLAEIEEKKIPLKHLLFNVKNTKKREVSLFQSKEPNIIFFMARVTDPFLSAIGMTYPRCVNVYLIQNQWIKLDFAPYSHNFWYFNILYAFLGLYIGIFFYVKVSEKAKNIVYLLRRGPPYNCESKN